MSSSQLQNLKSQYAAAAARATDLVGQVKGDVLLARPGPDQWSAGECLIHLNQTADKFIPIIEDALRQARPFPAGKDGTLNFDIMGRMLNWALKPARFKTRTSDPFVPVVGPAEEILPSFLQYQARLLGLLAQAEGKAIDRVKVASPFDRRVKYNLYSAFQIIVTHEIRHLHQAEAAIARIQTLPG